MILKGNGCLTQDIFLLNFLMTLCSAGVLVRFYILHCVTISVTISTELDFRTPSPHPTTQSYVYMMVSMNQQVLCDTCTN